MSRSGLSSAGATGEGSAPFEEGEEEEIVATFLALFEGGGSADLEGVTPVFVAYSVVVDVFLELVRTGTSSVELALTSGCEDASCTSGPPAVGYLSSFEGAEG